MLILQISILSAAASVGGVYLTEHAHEGVYALLFFMHELFFVTHSTLAICLTLYFMNVNGSALGRRPSFYWIFVAPYICGEIIIITNPLTKLAFYLDENFIYHRGPLMPLLYIMAVLYVATGFYFFFRYKRAISKANSIVICCVVALAIIGVCLQGLRPDMLVELFLEALAILTLMIILEDRTRFIDQETQVFNRRAFVDTNRRLMGSDQRYNIMMIRLLNLDIFSRLFDSRNVGRLMADIAAWLETVADREYIFRFWQEGFAIIINDTNEEKVGNIAKRVLERFENTWKTDEMAARIEAIVGIIRVPEDVKTLSKLQDIMISGFQHIKPRSLLLTRDDMTGVKRTLEVENAVRKAIKENDVQVWYQPIWSVKTGKIVAAEALSRIFDEDLGSILPDEFIPIAEKTGMIHELGSCVFGKVCRFIGQNRLNERGINYIDVNVSVYQFLREDLMSTFDKLRREWGVNAGQINLEITEGISYDEAPAVKETIAQMRKAGYSFSLDDYGTGYANLVRLIEKEYTNVKIDKAILWGGEKNPETAKLLDNLIRVIRSIDKNVVQEGVETKEQLKRVMDAGANLIQGYYFSRPLNEEDFLAYIEKMNDGEILTQ